MVKRTRLRALAAVVAAALFSAACSTITDGRGTPAGTSSPAAGNGSSSPGGTSGPSASGPTGPASASCPASYVQPDPDRPRITLTFHIAADHKTVTGTEKVVFTPDADITELVFRLTANAVPTYATGTRIRVTSATSDHNGGAPGYEQAGADPASQGGLLRMPVGNVKAGTTLSANLTFALTIGASSFDRFGRSGTFVWFATAQPLLAWERGYGWHTEPMIQFIAESATSEAADTDLTVTAPGSDTILAPGRPEDPRSSTGGRKTWHSTISAARDVSVAAGPFVLRDADVGGVKVRVGAPPGSGADKVMADEKFAIGQLTKRLGPFPFPTLSVALLPATGGGIEYPSSILLLGSQRVVTVHETAHQWFYAMVGDSQAQHAWLDEAFASFAEQLVDGDPPPADDVNVPGPVDNPTADYGADKDSYYLITYGKGAAALHAARAAARADKFDAALRCYVNAGAWKIAEPKDFAAALANLPAALAVLRRAGALT